MKIGSVKFFKFVIITTVLLLILVPTVLCIVFGVNGAVARRALTQANERIEDLTQLNSVRGALEGTLFASTLPVLSDDDALRPMFGEGSFDYQSMYPLLYSAIPAEKLSDDRVAYLTFDDGPSSNTIRILDILAQYDIKASFFVTGASSVAHPEYLQAVFAAGHTIGVHSYSHKYTDIYASPANYLSDFEKMYSTITDITGEAPSIFRFPGGSVNAYNSTNYVEIIAEMTRRGFAYYDWNVSSGDVAIQATTAEITDNVLSGAAKQNRCIILMHDRLDTDNTVDALPAIIEGLIEQGYTFAPLSSSVRPITFSYHK